jgi:phage repressor protein C with HTH and peptisase S24 domain
MAILKIVAGTTARAAADREQLPVLVAADTYFQDTEFAGMPMLRIRGDVMGDTLRSGDFAIIDTTDTDVSQGGIYAVSTDEWPGIFITQVTRVRGGSPIGRIRCTPHNPTYPPFELTLGSDVRIIGRVAHRVTTRYL